ncbi:MAG: hypothetical protein EOP11_01490, partial [Proteobacteria bacterium]
MLTIGFLRHKIHFPSHARGMRRRHVFFSFSKVSHGRVQEIAVFGGFGFYSDTSATRKFAIVELAARGAREKGVRPAIGALEPALKFLIEFSAVYLIPVNIFQIGKIEIFRSAIGGYHIFFTDRSCNPSLQKIALENFP